MSFSKKKSKRSKATVGSNGITPKASGRRGTKMSKIIDLKGGLGKKIAI